MVYLVYAHIIETFFQIAILSITFIILIELTIYNRKAAEIDHKLDVIALKSTKEIIEIDRYITPFADTIESICTAIFLAGACDNLLMSGNPDTDETIRDLANQYNFKAIQSLSRADNILEAILTTSWISEINPIIKQMSSKEKKKLLDVENKISNRLVSAYPSFSFSNSKEVWEISFRNAVERPFDLNLTVRYAQKNVQEMINLRSSKLPELRYSPSATEAIGQILVGVLCVCAESICLVQYDCVFSGLIACFGLLGEGIVKIIEWYDSGKDNIVPK